VQAFAKECFVPIQWRSGLPAHVHSSRQTSWGTRHVGLRSSRLRPRGASDEAGGEDARPLRAERAEPAIEEDPKQAAEGRSFATDLIVDDRSIGNVVEALQADLSSADGAWSQAPGERNHGSA
jgi:hypothetical protein